MQTIFLDTVKQNEFQKNGFVKIRLLDDQQIEQLSKHYKDHQHKTDDLFHISLDQPDPQKTQNISALIEKEVAKSLDSHFIDYQIFTSSYVVKEPGKKNIVPPHQDWSFVDESVNYSVTCWTPLIDVNQKNGALAIIKGTQNVFTTLRSSPSPESKSILSDHVFTLFPFVETIDLKAGESLVFDNRLIHASTPNLSEHSRVAVGIGLTGKEASLKHYFEDPSSDKQLILEYDVDRDFFYKWNNKKLSHLFNTNTSIDDYNVHKRLVNTMESYTKKEIENKITPLPGVIYNHDLMNHLSQLFNYNQPAMPLENDTKQDNNPEIVKEPKSFLKTYTPYNILKEVIWRIKGRP
jgi:hypothetical protein